MRPRINKSSDKKEYKSSDNSDKKRRFSSDEDKSSRTPRKRFDSDKRDDKPAFSKDKPFRKERDNSDRPRTERNDKPNFSKDKPFRRNSDSSEGNEKSRVNRGDKPAFSKDKPFRRNNDNSEGNDRPRTTRSDKPFEKDRFSKDKPYKKDRDNSSSERTPAKKKYFFDSPEDTRYEGKREHPERMKIYSSDPMDDEPQRTNRSSSKSEREFSVNDDAPRKVIRKAATEKVESGGMRLNRYIALSGVCSRREADVMIQTGAVMVNGVIVTELGTKVNPTDKVNVGGETLKSEKPRYILLNKPKDYITTMYDPQKRNTVMDLLGDACRERIYPVGRLDRNTTGLLLLTNDGDMAKKLTHPKYRVKKIYHVELDKSLAQKDFEAILNGITLEDGAVPVDELAYISPTTKKEVGIEIHVGRNRIVRRLFESLGYDVVKLDRVVFAGLTKKNLPRGKWRFLSEEELNMLKMNVFSR